MEVIIPTTAKSNSNLTTMDLKMNQFLVEIREPRKNRWTNPQTDKLVELWKEYIVLSPVDLIKHD